MENLEFLYVFWALLFQVILIVHYALRRWAFEPYVWRYGWLVYALGLPAFVVSLILLFGGQAWSFWLGGFICLVWAGYGYVVDYVQKVRWRNPIRWRIAGPYVLLYLATIMFYWWPLGLISRQLWYLGASLFFISTFLNITSHKESQDLSQIG